MKRFFCFLVLLGKCLASDTATLHLSLSVDLINKLTFTDVFPSIAMNQFTKDGVYGVHNTSTYALISNDDTPKKITASLDRLFPNQITLKITLNALNGWKAFPSQVIPEQKEVILMQGVPKKSNEEGLLITYEMQAPRLTPRNLWPFVRTVTFTLSDD